MGEPGTENVERRLAAILAMDVVGFSRMMGADEAGTLRRLKAIRADIIDPAISNAHGRTVKLMGDGILVEFDSAVHAVQCGIDVQDQLHRLNENLAEAAAMRMRMGINLGDVIIEGDDIYGDGVNIAARLESIADVGGIFVSASIQDSAHNKVSAAFEDLGEKQLKNIDHPVRVYRVGIEGAVESPERAMRTGVPGWAAIAALALIIAVGALIWNAEDTDDNVGSGDGKPIIAVLPFNNFSDDKDQEYFSDGLTEDLITDISKVSGVRVIARNSTFSYKGLAPDVRTVGKELGATHIIEGSVRKAGGTVRITVQLINAADGNHVWAERYDRELKDIFAVQDEVIGQIIAMLSIKLTPDEKARIANKGTDNVEAYDLLMRGRQQESFFNTATYVEAVAFYKRAIALDPNYAEAYAHLSIIHSVSNLLGVAENNDQASDSFLRLAEKAVALDPSLPIAHYALGRALVRPEFAEYGRAIEAFKTSIQLDPSSADGYANLALVSVFTGDAGSAIEIMEKAMRINPHYPFWYLFGRGMARYLLGDYTAAVEDLSKAAGRNPTAFFVQYWLVASLAQAGRIEDAEWQIQEMRGMGFEKTRDQLLKEIPVTFPAYKKKLIEGLRKARFQ